MIASQLPSIEQSVAAVVQKADERLNGLLNESGTILYSSRETLRRGKYYFLGVNPGGSPDEIKSTIQNSLDALASGTGESCKNAYLEQCWCDKKECKGCCRPLQRRFKLLFEDVLEEKDPKTVCASNLIFKRTRAERDAGGWKVADTCWPVHEVILDKVKPQVIITFGKLPFDFIHAKLGGTSPKPDFCGHGKWTWRYSILESDKKLIGLPHLSRLGLQKDSEVAERIKKLVGVTTAAPV